MLGIEDNWVFLAYLLCLASSLLCVIYGVMNWNRGDDAPTPADLRWAQHEQKVEQEL